MERSIKYESGEHTGIATTMSTDDGRSAAQSPSSGPNHQPQQAVQAMQQILSPYQLFQTQAGAAGQPGAPLSWMAPYQMMMLQGSGMTQPLFLPSNGASGVFANGAGGVFAMHDGQVFVAPINDGSGNNLMPVDISGNCVLPMANTDAAGGAVPSTPVRGALATASANREQKPDVPKPPKKPLTPYMIFSKQIWPQVKAEHAHLSSVTELGAIVGHLWRELDPNQKQQYNELYVQDKSRYDQELSVYLKETGLLATDVAKMRTKRPHHRPSPSASAAKVAATASLHPTWSNGTPAKPVAGQAPGAGVLPALYANHDGTITVGGAPLTDQKPNILPAYSDSQASALASTSANAQRSWAWNQPVATIDSGTGMIMYQMPQSDQTTAAAQLVYNGVPTSGSADSKAWFQSAGRVEQLETEIQRLRTALAEKTREAQNLRSELGSVLHSIEERRRGTPDGLQQVSYATDLQPANAPVENNNTAKTDMSAHEANGLPE